MSLSEQGGASEQSRDSRKFLTTIEKLKSDFPSFGLIINVEELGREEEDFWNEFLSYLRTINRSAKTLKKVKEKDADVDVENFKDLNNGLMDMRREIILKEEKNKENSSRLAYYAACANLITPIIAFAHSFVSSGNVMDLDSIISIAEKIIK